ncbi:hypothetical protein ACHAWC_006046 [Mediolabrus comicus]
MERKNFLLLLLTLSIICACCPGVVAFAPPHPIRSRIASASASASSTHSKSSPLNAIPLFPGTEDIIFNAQNAASTLANSVISTSGASAGAAGQLQSLVLLYIAGLWTSFSPCSAIAHGRGRACSKRQSSTLSRRTTST